MAGSFLFSRGLRITAAVCLLLGIVLPLPLFPACFFKTITGISCPGCGLTRAICAISHGRIADAWHWHPFSFIFYGGALFIIFFPMLASFMQDSRSLMSRCNQASAKLALPLVIAMILFWLWRMYTHCTV
jgi:hypothetical protein